MFRATPLLALFLLAACGTAPPPTVEAGRFDGILHVIWIGEGDPSVGDGRFVYVPDPADPLTFERAHSDGTVDRITPEIMFTDGGSIPRPVTLFRGFSPWGYAPAYVVHDWLFVAANCNTDGAATPAEQALEGMPFEESAQIIDEAIRALVASGRVRPNDLAQAAIPRAVQGRISRRAYEAVDRCPERRVPDDLRRLILLSTPGQALADGRDRGVQILGGERIVVNARNIVASIEF